MYATRSHVVTHSWYVTESSREALPGQNSAQARARCEITEARVQQLKFHVRDMSDS